MGSNKCSFREDRSEEKGRRGEVRTEKKSKEEEKTATLCVPMQTQCKSVISEQKRVKDEMRRKWKQSKHFLDPLRWVFERLSLNGSLKVYSHSAYRVEGAGSRRTSVASV